MKSIISKSYLLLACLSGILPLFLGCSSQIDNSIVIDPVDDEIKEASTNVPDSYEFFKEAPSTSGVQQKQTPTEIVSPQKSEVNSLEDRCVVVEEKDLFNGKNLDGWVNQTHGAPQGWIVKDGILRLDDPLNGGDLLTSSSFENYVLSFEWRFGRECNSGIKYKIVQPNNNGWVGLEYQIQDDAHVEDGKIDKRRIASLFDVLPAQTSTKSSEYPAPEVQEPSDEFRSGKIVVVNNQVEHWIDNERVLTFTIGSDEWNVAKSQSKFKNQKDFGMASQSPILLQAHGFPVEFKSVKIKTLKVQP